MFRKGIPLILLFLMAALAVWGMAGNEKSRLRKEQEQQHLLDQADQVMKNIKETQPATDRSKPAPSRPAGDMAGSGEEAVAGDMAGSKAKTVSGNEAGSKKDAVPETGSIEAAGADSESIEEAGADFGSIEAAGSGKGSRAIFVGDSRTVGMAKAEKYTGCTCRYIGMSGEGYEWFAEEGFHLLEETIREEPSLPVIYNLGVNDCENITRYLSLYRELEEAWTDTDFYYLSVNPVTEDSVHVTNEEIEAFNASLKSAFGDRFWDSNTWLKDHDFECVDGVHYSEQTYRDIHDFALAQLTGP